MMTALPIVVSYLLGGIPFGWLVPRAFGVADIRGHGSGNVGATNVGRVLGYKAAVWVFLGDIGKGILAVLLGRWFASQFDVALVSNDALLLLCALAAVLGHIFTPFLGFKGGKGVNTALGSMVALLPIEALLSLVTFSVILALSRYVSLSSMCAGLAFFAFIVIERYALNKPVADVYVWAAGLLAGLILVTHRGNIARLIAGTEHRLNSSAGVERNGSNV